MLSLTSWTLLFHSDVLTTSLSLRVLKRGGGSYCTNGLSVKNISFAIYSRLSEYHIIYFGHVKIANDGKNVSAF